MFIRVAWGLMVAGVLLLITASVMASRHRTSMDGTAIVPATVIDRQMVLTNGINRNRPVVSFITGAGKNVAFISMSTLRLEDDLGAAIVDLAANVPYGVQRLGHETWDDLKADGRKTVMLADVRTRHRLPGSSTVQAALAALVRPDIVMKEGSRYLANDSLYREWVARPTFA